MRRTPTPDDSFKTLTHARLRAAQGDADGACRLLCDLLRERPRDPEARALLEEIGGAASRPVPLEVPPSERAPSAGDPVALADEFRRALEGERSPPARRIRRLEGWLARICRNPG